MKKYDYYINRNDSSPMRILDGKCGCVTKVLKDGSFFVKGSSAGVSFSVLVKADDNGRVIGHFCPQIS